jgi:hypothetical protein
MPLHEFCPLQEEDAVLHALVPLHELMPLHWTAVPSADAVAESVPKAKAAAAEAIQRLRLVIRPPETSKHRADDGRHSL